MAFGHLSYPFPLSTQLECHILFDWSPMQVKQHQSQTTVDVLQCLYKCYHKRELVLSDFWRFFNVKAFLDIVLKTKVLLLSKLLRVPTLLTVDVFFSTYRSVRSSIWGLISTKKISRLCSNNLGRLTYKKLKTT